MRRCFCQQFRGGVAEAALIEDEEIEPGEARCDPLRISSGDGWAPVSGIGWVDLSVAISTSARAS